MLSRLRPSRTHLVAVLVAIASGQSPLPSLERDAKILVDGHLEVTPAFIENLGQLDERVSYILQGRDKTIYFTKRGVTLVLTTPRGGPAGGSRWATRLDLRGSNDVAPEGTSLAPTLYSYFGAPRSTSVAGARSYSQIVYRDVWPGIDLRFDAEADRLKYSFVLQPGADPSNIQLAWRGTSAVSLAKGGMEVQTPAGTLFDDPPVAWQGEAGDRKDVAVAFRAEPRLSGLDDSDSFGFGFEVEPYDRSRELVIDPVFFVYAGFIGGCCTDQGRDIAVDSHGNAYITGITQSPETTFPDGDGFGAVPGFDQSNLTVAAFVAKINPAGSTLLYASYLQGSEFIEGLGIAVDGAGSAYVTGRTGSNAGFVYDDDGVGSVAGPDTTYNGGNTDAFVAKIDPSGTSLLYAGFIGGSGDDAGEAIAVDAAGNAYVTGFTGSHETTFPDGDGFGAVPGMDQSFNGGGDDAFLIRIDAAGSGFDYATYIGGAGGDAGRSVAVDSIGNAYVAGVAGAASTEASFPDGDGFGLVSGFDVTHNGNSEAFVVKVDPTGLGLVYGGFIGGSGIDSADGVVIDAMGSAYVVGSTSSDETTFPDGDGFGALAGPDTSFNGGPVDAFVVKIDPTGDHLVYAGYVGGASTDLAQGIAVGADGSAYLGGQTGSDETQFPGGNGFGGLQGADTTYNGAQDAFVAKVNPTGIGFAWASFIGGSAGDQGFGLAADGMGSLYVVGTTFSDEATFPNGNGSGPQLGPDLSFNGNQDVFVVRIQETLQAPAIDVPLSGTSSVLLALSLLALGIGFISHASGRS